MKFFFIDYYFRIFFKKNYREELDDDCEIDFFIIILFLSFRVLIIVVVGDWSILRESFIFLLVGLRSKYFICVKELNLKLIVF